MLTKKRTATFAVMIAAAIVPSLGVHAAEARPAPVGVELCHPKLVLGPYASEHTQTTPSIADFDVENATASGEPDDVFDPETVQWDDLSYDGC